MEHEFQYSQVQCELKEYILTLHGSLLDIAERDYHERDFTREINILVEDHVISLSEGIQWRTWLAEAFGDTRDPQFLC